MVTGGCGFIGSFLVRRLLTLGVAHVVVVDSLRYGTEANLGPHYRSEKIAVLPFTLGDDSPQRLQTALEGVDYLFHLAAEKHNQSQSAPGRIVRANVEGTRLLFELALRAGVRKAVFSSSLYAYGRLHEPPMSEEEVPQPRTIYGISKLCGEHLLAHYTQDGGMKGDCLRYFFVYGPRQYAGTGYKSVILKNFERIVAGERPVIFGDGMQALDYVFVDDVIDATIACMCTSGSGGLFNVASGNAVSVKSLIETMLEVSEMRLTPVHEAPDWTAGTFRVGGADRARTLLGWTPQISLPEGLRRTWSWVRGFED
jgi:UDP-glucose 4-epimerase